MEKAFKDKQKEWAKVVAQAWVDEEFKKKLIADPKAVLEEYGIEFPPDVKVNMLESTQNEVNIALPLRPEGLTGSVEELQTRVQANAGGTGGFCGVFSGVF